MKTHYTEFNLSDETKASLLEIYKASVFIKESHQGAISKFNGDFYQALKIETVLRDLLTALSIDPMILVAAKCEVETYIENRTGGIR